MDWMILYPLLLLIVLLPKCVFFLKLSSALQPIYLTAYLTFLLLSLKSWTCDLLSCLWNSRIFFCIANASTIYLFLHTRYLSLLWSLLSPFILSINWGLWILPLNYLLNLSIFDCHLSSLNYHLFLRLGSSHQYLLCSRPFSPQSNKTEV